MPWPIDCRPEEALTKDWTREYSHALSAISSSGDGVKRCVSATLSHHSVAVRDGGRTYAPPLAKCTEKRPARDMLGRFAARRG